MNNKHYETEILKPSIVSHEELVEFVQELCIQNCKLKQQMQEFETYIQEKEKTTRNIKRNNIFVSSALQKNSETQEMLASVPSFSFDCWKEMVCNGITEEHVLMLETIKLADLFDFIKPPLQENIILPFCFHEKTKKIYIWKKDWSLFDKNEFIIFVKSIVNTLFKVTCNWYKINMQEINNSEKLSILYPTILKKLTSIKYNHSTIHKIIKKLIGSKN
jgi:hypothetical protein